MPCPSWYNHWIHDKGVHIKFWDCFPPNVLLGLMYFPSVLKLLCKQRRVSHDIHALKKKRHRHHDPHCEHGGFSSCSMLSSNEGCTISPDHHCAALRSCDLQGGQLNWAELAGIFREISLWKMRCPTHLRDTSRKIWCHVSLAKDIAIYCDVVFFPAWKMMVSCFNSTSLVHDRKDPHKY